jgi:hypothetical protein
MLDSCRPRERKTEQVAAKSIEIMGTLIFATPPVQQMERGTGGV